MSTIPNETPKTQTTSTAPKAQETPKSKSAEKPDGTVTTPVQKDGLTNEDRSTILQSNDLMTVQSAINGMDADDLSKIYKNLDEARKKCNDGIKEYTGKESNEAKLMKEKFEKALNMLPLVERMLNERSNWLNAHPEWKKETPASGWLTPGANSNDSYNPAYYNQMMQNIQAMTANMMKNFGQMNNPMFGGGITA